VIHKLLSLLLGLHLEMDMNKKTPRRIKILVLHIF